MYKSTEIAKFMREHIKSHFPELDVVYKSRFYLQMNACVVRGLIIGVGKGGYIKVLPVMYVVGADLSEDELSPGLCTELYDRQTIWQFPEDTPLNEVLAIEIKKRVNNSPAINFLGVFTQGVIERDIQWFAKRPEHWAANLDLAFFNMTRGAPTARKDLARAFELFRRKSRMVTDKPLRDWEEALLARFQELESRLDRPDCISLCRADSEKHARLLKLPPIVWPPEWPEAVPPWSKEPDSLIAKLGGFLTRKP